MTFGEAMCALERGKKIRCSSWRGGSIITRRERDGIVSYGSYNDIAIGGFSLFHPSISDMHSKDWEVVE